MPTFTNYDALKDFIFEDMKKQIKDYIDNTDYIDPENCVWEQNDVIDELTDWTCFPSFEINFGFPQFAILINKLNDNSQLVGGEFQYTDALLTDSVISCIYNENIFELDEYATALCEEKQIIMRREAEERNERLEAEYREREAEYIIDSVTRAHARGGLDAISERITGWLRGQETNEARRSFITENLEIACDRLGINFRFCVATEEEIEEKKKEIELKSLTDFKHPIAELPTFAEIDIDEQVKTSEIENQIQKLKDRRERMGAVNLRADNETQELQDQIDRMMNDRKDLVQGIQKLKSSINDLNEKGRERLLDAFEKVSRKFNDVYTKLFAGGNARLELIESDDPLEAGLELLVSPPGKKLQSITLLSGGEQALTAMALIFAVFLINPSPICILDEVDAPLDDANVTRFCSLLDELSSVTDTKFVVITHHALTMSRMNRLYGVTMAERGVSQLVAVDLEKAEEMVA